MEEDACSLEDNYIGNHLLVALWAGTTLVIIVRVPEGSWARLGAASRRC